MTIIGSLFANDSLIYSENFSSSRDGHSSSVKLVLHSYSYPNSPTSFSKLAIKIPVSLFASALIAISVSFRTVPSK